MKLNSSGNSSIKLGGWAAAMSMTKRTINGRSFPIRQSRTVGPKTSVTQPEIRLLVTQALWLERHKTTRRVFLTYLKALEFSEWYTSSDLTLQSPEALAQKSNASRPFIGLWPGKVVSSFVRYHVCSAWQSLPEKASFFTVKHMLRNKASLLNYFLKFLTMLLSSVPISTSSLTMPPNTV